MANDDRDDEETDLDESEDDESADDDESEDDESDDDGSDDGGSEDGGSDDDESDDDESDDGGSEDGGSEDGGSDDGGSDDGGSEDGGSEDDGSEDDESEDDGSEDDGSEDDGSEDDGEIARPTKPVHGKTGKRTEKRRSAAARVAAARAAKAARKAAKRGKERKDEKAPLAAMTESTLGRQAAKAGDWASDNRMTVYAVAAVVALVLAAGIGWYYYQQRQTEAGGALLAEAIRISTAPIRDEDEAAEPDDPPSYPTVSARSEAALTAYDAVVAQHAGTEAAAWAQLGRGEALLDLGRPADAREAFEAAIQAGGTDGAILWRALEGKGFTFEAQEEWARASEVYQELSRIDDGRFDPVAKYHIARMYISQGQEEEATEALSALVDDLRDAADDDERQEFAYVLAQAEVRLRELDPSAAPARPTLGEGIGGDDAPLGSGGGGPGDLTPEQLQRLIEQLQSKQGGSLPGGE